MVYIQEAKIIGLLLKKSRQRYDGRLQMSRADISVFFYNLKKSLGESHRLSGSFHVHR